MAIEEIAWIEQFAEIARSHLKCWHCQRARIREDEPHPFLSPVPENFGLVGIEVVGDVERSPDVVSELIVVNRRGDTSGCRARIAQPRVCIEDGIADIFVGGAVELL